MREPIDRMLSAAQTLEPLGPHQPVLPGQAVAEQTEHLSGGKASELRRGLTAEVVALHARSR